MLKTGEKIMPKFKSAIIRPCDQVHPDYMAVRVEDLTINLDRPAPKAKSTIIRTGDVS